MAMATGTILTKKWQPKVSAMVLTSWQLTAGGLVLLPLALCFEQLPAMLTADQILAYAWLGLVGTGLTYILWLRGVLRLSATAVSSISLLSPVSATLLGLLVLQQTLDLAQSLGMVLVLGSVLIGQLRSQAPPVKPAMEPASTSTAVTSN
jgi:probable blue pigment (indigoidine) exporter